MSNFIASISAIGAHSILNFYSENVEKIIKAFLKRVFNLKLEENDKDDSEKPE